MVELLQIGSEFKLTEDEEIVKEWSDNSKILKGKKGKVVGLTGRVDFIYTTRIEGLTNEIDVREKDIIPINEDWKSIIDI